jgi:hypothetical protein
MLAALTGLLGGGGGGGGSFESIATATGNGSSATITFNSIPSTYKHLQIRGVARDTYTGFVGDVGFTFTFNVNSSAVYTRHRLIGDGSSATAAGAANQGAAYSLNGDVSSASSNTLIYGVSIIDILDYASTSKFKTARVFAGSDGNVSSNPNYAISLNSSLWRSTDAITSIEITAGGSNFASNSQFALYGIKG